MSISDMIVVMKDGAVQQIGKPQEVYDNPVNLFVAKFLGTPPINVFAGTIRDGKLWIGGGAVLELVPAPGGAERAVSVAVRPEGFLLREDGPFCCELGGIEVLGRDISVILSHEASQNATARAIIGTESAGQLQLGEASAAGRATLCFRLIPRKVFLFDRETEERVYFGVCGEGA